MSQKTFWYGVLCQAADIFLPAPTPFKAWLHEKMGFTDSVSVLFEKEVYEADLSVGGYSIQEEGSPFALVNNAVKASTGKELSSEAYRQVSYVNDISFSNEQVLMERAVNGSLGESVTGYSYGMWRESLSQNRYTYAENNPVTFADPSGHKTFGAILGDALRNATGIGKNSNTGKNSSGGIGGIIGNAFQKITGRVSTVQNTPQNTYNRATGNRGAIVTAIYDNIIAQAKGGITSILGGGSPSVNGPRRVISFVESVAAKIEKVRCQAYENCKNIVQEVINDIGWRFATTYAVHGTMYDPLPMEQQIANAEYIYNYLHAQGWSLEAICGVLGNIHIECHYNPGTWQYLDDANYGFGLVQWSDAESKFLNYLNDIQFGGKYKTFELIEVVNEMATNSPKELMELEMTYFIQSCKEDQWAPTREYECPAIVSFEEYVENEGDYNVREMAMIFHGTYEKSSETDSYVKRENWAEGWYKHFTGEEDIRECYKKYDY